MEYTHFLKNIKKKRTENTVLVRLWEQLELSHVAGKNAKW